MKDGSCEGPFAALVALIAANLYTFFALISVFFILKLVKETKGKALEDM